MSDTREKLVKLLAECFDKCLKSSCAECEHFNAPPIIGNSRSCQANLFADHLIANGVTVADNLSPTELLTNCQQWIPVTERLPKKMGQYVCRYVFGENAEYPFFQVLWYFANLEKPHFQHEGSMGLRVTHWMPMPEPPKGE